MIFKLYDCDLGIKVNGVSYNFEHVDSVTIDDPERNNLTRGANVGNKVGISYREGIKEPKRWTIPIMNMSAELKGVLDGCFEDQTRIDVFCISRTDGSSKMAKNALLANAPQQLTLDESPESMQVSLEFVTFDSSEVHKS